MQKPIFKNKFFYIGIGFFFLLVIYVFTALPPRSYPTGIIISVPQGTGLHELGQILKRANVIKSQFWFRMAALAQGGERILQAGEYYLHKPQNVFILAWRIVHGDYRLATTKVTIPEGYTVKKISELFTEERFPFFDNEYFIRAAPEGFLFPDTYLFQENATATSTIKILRDSFIRKIFPLMGDVESSGKTLEEIIIMASILEGEAKTYEDMQIVSDILWKRIRENIPLQVDATFSYINGKTTRELTVDDLKIKSPYNTYLYPGLPPTPISNPGLDSINAATHPTTTPYMYFLTGDDGKMYYSKNFEEHKRYKIKHISP